MKYKEIKYSEEVNNELKERVEIDIQVGMTFEII